MPRRSVAKRREGGPILSANELRLGKPCPISRGSVAQRIQASLQTSQKLRSFTSRNDRSRDFNADRSGICLAFSVAMAGGKRFVYVLKNADPTPHFYVGLTADVNARVSDHNTGRCPHTASRRPWQHHVVIEFPDESRAIRFEQYLKSGSGRAFARRHFEQ
jgi:predicted GIY-YIG superfamily endonuclease